MEIHSDLPADRDGGRAAFDRHAWSEALTRLAAADRATPLPPEDLERLAIAAHLLGKETESEDWWARAHQGFVEQGAPGHAARCAFWLGIGLQERGEHARAGGWIARAQRLLDDAESDVVERGYLLLPTALGRAARGAFDEAYARFTEAAAVGERFGDRDLITIARHGQGRALINQGRVGEGLALLDEVMVGVTAGEVSPPVTGIVYCSVLSACHQTFDWRRAREWTAALSRWCEAQPEVVPYRGQCLVRRAEVLRLQGDWTEAMTEARRAGALLDRGAASAWYQVAELHRLRGEFAEARESYREASERGRNPEPGLALLCLARGQVDAAAAAMRRAIAEPADLRRPLVLHAAVEILLAAGDVPAAREAGRELREIAERIGAPYLAALAGHAAGAVLLADDRAQEALTPLREAARTWTDLDAPYEAARTRVVIGLACRALDDLDGGSLELEAACHALEALGATPDCSRVRALLAAVPAGDSGGLTARELQVLRLVATGKTNRAIAAALGISDKTVARHVSNIFTKLDLSSRAAATAFAYERGIV